MALMREGRMWDGMQHGEEAVTRRKEWRLFFFGEAKRSQLTKYLYRPRMLANQATS